MLARSTIRGWQIDQLRKGLTTVDSILKSAPPQAASVYRDGGSGWTALEVLCHLRDYDALFLERARMTVEQDMPALPNPDPDALAIERQYYAQEVEAVHAEWVSHRKAFLSYLESLDETAWDRVAAHPRRGNMALHDQLALVVWHDVNHIEQITRTLVEQKTA